jgi:transglutaminase-like putative cysteine protease
MGVPATIALRRIVLSCLLLVCVSGPRCVMADEPQIHALIEKGAFAEAEKRLQEVIPDDSAPITSDAAIQLEILRRTRQEFSLTGDDVLAHIRKSVSAATMEDVDRWRESGDLQSRTIDGEPRYFNRAVSNLFRFNADAQRRRGTRKSTPKFDLNAHLESLVQIADSADGPEIYPVRHHVRYELVVKEGHPRLKAGAQVRAWLPFPQQYRQQRDVRLIRADPPNTRVADENAPQRTIYFEQTITDPNKPPRFMAEFEFVTSAYCPKLDPADVQPYDKQSALYREFTAERQPHIAITPEVQRLADEIVGDETNPLEKTRCLFRWVSHHVPWCSEMEYSIIPSLSAKGLSARRGDCGVQGLTFITLCRAAGVPARWQSGWQTKPDNWNMHDWSEFYVEPWGWLPADASYGVRDHPDPRVQDFLCGHMDPYRLIVNLDYGRALQPPKISFRSEPNDFQRGEIEIDGHNLYFDEWDWKFRVETTPLSAASQGSRK